MIVRLGRQERDRQTVDEGEGGQWMLHSKGCWWTVSDKDITRQMVDLRGCCRKMKVNGGHNVDNGEGGRLKTFVTDDIAGQLTTDSWEEGGGQERTDS